MEIDEVVQEIEKHIKIRCKERYNFSNDTKDIKIKINDKELEFKNVNGSLEKLFAILFFRWMLAY